MCLAINPSAKPWRVKRVYKVVQKGRYLVDNGRNDGGYWAAFTCVHGRPTEYKLGEWIKASGNGPQSGFHVFLHKKDARNLVIDTAELVILECAVHESDLIAVGIADKVSTKTNGTPNATYRWLKPLKEIA